MLRARLTGIEPAIGRLERGIGAELERTLERASKRVADEAKRSHAFENRTGDLERSIRPLDVHRSADFVFVGGVVADTDYGEYVEASRPFLQPAFDRLAPGIENELEFALEQAARRAGW
jgi:hypothetical protein